MRLSSYFRAFLTIFTSILLAMLIGSFIATPDNPAQTRQSRAKLDAAVQQDMTFTKAELEAYFASPALPDPPFLAAVLDWHAWLLVPSGIAAFLLFRPKRIPAFVMASIASACLYYSVAPNPAFFLLIGTAAGCISADGLSKLRRHAPHSAA